MNISFFVLTGILLIVLFIWMFRVNRKERGKLEEKLNRNYPVHEKHKEAEDPENAKGN
ncbi:hypothetical protein [Flavihumibacter profundi]|uniref:hypothetical protein n=1 Tax=Flavihumibacter profundi TaxID=2716883 RepID=UPI001CC4D28D|nr:hypothetical protein [Flavihumibacter profundi]MBZ5856794.1 hypothetical protein [Flavihumibacter profundi]